MKQLHPALRFTGMFALALALTLVIGCAALDSFFGVSTTPGVSAPGTTPANEVSNLLSVLIPGWGTIAGVGLTALGWLYTSMRGKKSIAALPNVILGVIQAVMGAKDGNVDVGQLYSSLAGASVLFSNKDKFAKLVADVQAAIKAERNKGANAGDLIAAVAKDVEDIEAIPAPAPAAAAPATAPAPAAPSTTPPASA